MQIAAHKIKSILRAAVITQHNRVAYGNDSIEGQAPVMPSVASAQWDGMVEPWARRVDIRRDPTWPMCR